MSTSYTFSLTAVNLFLLLILDIGPRVDAFTIRRSDNFTYVNYDLQPEESIKLDVRNDLRRSNHIQLTKEVTDIPSTDIYSKAQFLITSPDTTMDTNSDATETNPELTFEETTTAYDDQNISNFENLTPSEARHLSEWKKYTSIDRKYTSTEQNDASTTSENVEEMVLGETGVPRQDSKSDLPSLNQIKNFLFPSSFFKSDAQNGSKTSKEITETTINDNTESTIEPTSTDKNNPSTVESKRGGFLDFSLKSLFEDSDKKDNSQENNSSKPKGRRLSWRFGSRYRGKEDSSAEKDREKSRFRFRNNKDRKSDNENKSKNSKEDYSKEIVSKEVSSKEDFTTLYSKPKNEAKSIINTINEEDTLPKTIDNKSRNSDDNHNEKNVSEEKQILAKWNHYENRNGNHNETSTKMAKPERHEDSERKQEKKTTDINIWKTDSSESKTSKNKSDDDKKEKQERIEKKNKQQSRERNDSSSSEKDYSRHRNKNKEKSKNEEQIGEYSNEESRSQQKNDRKNSRERNNEEKEIKNKSSKDKNHEKPRYRQNEERTHSDFNQNQARITDAPLLETTFAKEEKSTTTQKDSGENIPSLQSNTNNESSIPDPGHNDSQKPITIEYIKQYLSTIDEEEDSEPNITEDTTTTKPKNEIPNIVAVKYPSDFRDSDMITTPEAYDRYEPYKIPNLLINLPSPRSKDGGAGYFNTDTETQISTESNKYRDDFNRYQQNTTGTFERSSSEETYEDRRKTGAVEMHEDARKEELLKEEIINNYAENIGRYKEDYTSTTQTTIPVKIYEVNKKTEKENSTVTTDDKLKVKPLSLLDKLKTTILYPVGSNYKPPKKIEVQPPKIFVRDPDDNSWRNESLSSLGIVFKPKNSSKPLTQVLKNKTETELYNLQEKINKNETPDLRERLEKIAEMRKTKKKKTDANGNVLNNDYEDTSSREEFLKNETPTSTTPTSIFTPTNPATMSPVISTSTQASATKSSDRENTIAKSTPGKPKKVFNVAEYYDSSEEDDSDYLTMAKIDLKKFTVPYSTDTYVTPPTWFVTNPKHDSHKHERKPTVQYFPPLTTQKGMFRDYDNDYRQRMSSYTDTEPPTNVLPVSYTKQTTSEPRTTNNAMFTPNIKQGHFMSFTKKPVEPERPAYVTQVPHDPRESYTLVTDDGSYDRAADVIKHYRDFLSAAARDHDEDKNVDEYVPYTKIPQGVTTSEAIVDNNMKHTPAVMEHYDYENDFRKDVLQRFVHNFNQNSERFKTNLPLLYNNSIIHDNPEGGRDVASSRAYMSRLLSRPSGDCDNSTVELSPAYELHYYVPEQEEKQERDAAPVTMPQHYHNM